MPAINIPSRPIWLLVCLFGQLFAWHSPLPLKLPPALLSPFSIQNKKIKLLYIYSLGLVSLQRHKLFFLCSVPGAAPATGDGGVQLYLLHTAKSGVEPMSTRDGIKVIIYDDLSGLQNKPSGGKNHRSVT